MQLILCLLFIFSFFVNTYAMAEEARWEKVQYITPEKANQFIPEEKQSDFKTIDQKLLQKIKGIGPKKAAAIVEYRKQHGPFKSVKDLAKVKGFSEKILAKIMKENPELK